MRLPTFAIFGVVAAAAMASGCQPAEGPASAEQSSAPAPAPATMPALASLAGEYRVAGIDGTEVGGGIGLALSVTDTLMWFDPRCAGFNWTYTFKDGALHTDRPQKPRPPGGPLVAGPGRHVCAIAVHPEQVRLAKALDAVTAARRTPSNGIELTGGGHSVSLYSQ